MKHLILCLIITLILGCKEQNSTNAPVTNQLELKLDNGKKWLANPETQLGIYKMDSIIKNFKGKSPNDYNTCGNALAKQTSYIIKNCSMEGEPHDQLHVVLLPMLENISVLRESGNLTQLQQAEQNLKELIQAYYTYFNK